VDYWIILLDYWIILLDDWIIFVDYWITDPDSCELTRIIIRFPPLDIGWAKKNWYTFQSRLTSKVLKVGRYKLVGSFLGLLPMPGKNFRHIY